MPHAVIRLTAVRPSAEFIRCMHSLLLFHVCILKFQRGMRNTLKFHEAPNAFLISISKPCRS